MRSIYQIQHDDLTAAELLAERAAVIAAQRDAEARLYCALDRGAARPDEAVECARLGALQLAIQQRLRRM
jgi:hypothetical protein